MFTDSSKHFNIHYVILMRQILLVPLYSWGNQGTNNQPKVTRPISDNARIQISVVWLLSPKYLPAKAYCSNSLPTKFTEEAGREEKLTFWVSTTWQFVTCESPHFTKDKAVLGRWHSYPRPSIWEAELSRCVCLWSLVWTGPYTKGKHETFFLVQNLKSKGCMKCRLWEGLGTEVCSLPAG